VSLIDINFYQLDHSKKNSSMKSLKVKMMFYFGRESLLNIVQKCGISPKGSYQNTSPHFTYVKVYSISSLTLQRWSECLNESHNIWAILSHTNFGDLKNSSLFQAFRETLCNINLRSGSTLKVSSCFKS